MRKRRERRTRHDVYAKLLEIDDKLAAKSFPRISWWWKDVLRGFYQSGKRWLVLRVGRRGGKSSTLCRLAVAEVLYGGHDVPPGDIGYWAFISTTREEAAARLTTIRAILDALGVKYRPVENGVVIEGRNVGFKTYAATIAGVSGFTAIGFTADEVAKWKDKETGANPAKEVLKSLKPTLATMKRAKGILSSSPFSTIDAHAEAFDRGDTDDQMVARGATWETNPTISEEDTKELEEDEATRMREYGAIPMGSGAAMFFDTQAIDAAINKALVMPVRALPGMTVTDGGDLAFVSDSAALVSNHRIGEWEKARCRIADILELRPKPGAPLKPGDVVAQFAARMRSHGVSDMMADGHYRMSVVEHLDEHQLGFMDAPTVVSDPYVRFRVLLNGSRMELPNEPRFIRQLKQTMGRPTPTGAISISHPRDGGHGDIVSAAVLAVWQRHGFEVPADVGPVDPVEQALLEELRQEQRKGWWANKGPRR